MPFGSPLFWTQASKQPFPNRSLSLLQVFVPPLRLKVSSLPSPNRFGVLTPSYSQSVVSHSPVSMYTFSSEWPIDRHPKAASLGPQRLLREHGSRSADVWPELWTGYPFCCLYGDTMWYQGGQLWAHLLSLKSQKFACARTIEMIISRQMMKEEMVQNCLKYLEIQ